MNQKNQELEKEYKLKSEELEQLEEYNKLKEKRKTKKSSFLDVLEKESKEKKRILKSKQIKRILGNNPVENKDYKVGEEEIMKDRKEKLVNEIDEINPKLKTLLYKVLGKDGIDFNKLYKGNIPKEVLKQKIDELSKKSTSANDLPKINNFQKKRFENKFENSNPNHQLERFIFEAFKENQKNYEEYSNQPKKPKIVEKIVEKIIYLNKKNFARASPEYILSLRQNKRLTNIQQVNINFQQFLKDGEYLFYFTLFISFFLFTLIFYFLAKLICCGNKERKNFKKEEINKKQN